MGDWGEGDRLSAGMGRMRALHPRRIAEVLSGWSIFQNRFVHVHVTYYK